MKENIIKVHAKNGVTMRLNTKYIVRYCDNEVVVDDYVYKPDCRMPESKNMYRVFETANEIDGLINGKISDDELDQKYAAELEQAKRDCSPF